MRPIATFLLLAFLGVRAWAQPVRKAEIDLSGAWEGVARDAERQSHKATVRIEIEQEGSQLTGLSKTFFSRRSHAASHVRGVLRPDSTVEIVEMDAIAELTAGDELTDWCLTAFKGKLKISENGCYLVGSTRSVGLMYNAYYESYSTGVCGGQTARFYKPTCLRYTEEPAGPERKPLAVPAPLAARMPQGLQPGADSSPIPVIEPRPWPEPYLDPTIRVVDSVTVAGPELTLRYKDGDRPDGDRISISLDNTRVFARSLRLRRRYRTLKLHLTEPSTFLVLKAEDAGRGGEQARATTSLILSDGQSERKFELDPAQGEARAIRIRWR